MLTNLNDISSVRKSAEIEIPSAEVRKEFSKVLSEFSRQAKVPGFRPGKIPVQVIRTRFTKEIEQETLDRLLPRFFQQTVAGKGLEPVGRPHVTHVDALTEDADLKFAVEFEIRPVVTLGEYRGLQITEKSGEVPESEIDRVVDRLRDRAGVMRSVTDRGAADGDDVVVDVSSSGEGVESRRTDGYRFHMGDDAPMSELVDAVRGHAAGDEVTFDKKYDDDAPNDEVRGRTVTYIVTIREIQMREMPDLTDGFVKSIEMGENVQEMRERILRDLKRHREHEVMQAKRQQVSDQLIERHELEIPEALVHEELDKSIREYARYLASQGVDLERAEIDWAKVREEFRPEAEKRVKRSLILESISKQENLQVSDVEVDAEIRKAATASSKEFAQVKHRLRDDGGYEELRRSLMQERALELVLTSATMVPA